MIISSIISMFNSIISGILSFLPTGNLPTNVSSAFGSLASSLALINSWVSLTTIFTVITAILAIEATLMGFKLLLFIYKLIRG